MQKEICHCDRQDSTRHLFDVMVCEYRTTPPEEGSGSGSKTLVDAPLTPPNVEKEGLGLRIKSPQLYHLSYGPNTAESLGISAGSAETLNGGAPPGSESGSKTAPFYTGRHHWKSTVCGPQCSVCGMWEGEATAAGCKGAAPVATPAVPVAGSTPVVPGSVSCSEVFPGVVGTVGGCTVPLSCAQRGKCKNLTAQRRALDLCSCTHTAAQHFPLSLDGDGDGHCAICACARFTPHPQPGITATVDVTSTIEGTVGRCTFAPTCTAPALPLSQLCQEHLFPFQLAAPDAQLVATRYYESARVRARLFMLPSGRWHADVTGPGGKFCAISTPDAEKAVYFIVRRLRGAE